MLLSDSKENPFELLIDVKHCTCVIVTLKHLHKHFVDTLGLQCNFYVLKFHCLQNATELLLRKPFEDPNLSQTLHTYNCNIEINIFTDALQL